MKSLFARKKRLLVFVVVFLFIIVSLFPYVLYGIMRIVYASVKHVDIETVPERYSAVVLGAGLFADGSPSHVLYDRVDAAVALYKAGKVKKIIMSGDNRFDYYNEPDVMIRTAIEKGVPEDVLQPDYAGRRTYDTCWRAKNIFSQEGIILVTQRFHMTRGIFLCRSMGIETDGFIADNRLYPASERFWWTIRDIYALSLSVIDVYIRRPAVVGGDKIDIQE